MLELLSESLRLVNLPFTILLGLVIIYWLLVAIGALGGEHGDMGGQAGGDADFDAHHQAEGNHQAHHESGSFSAVLKFVNLGDVPAMVVLTFLILSLWVFSVLANYYVTGDSVLLKAAALVVNLAVALVVTRYATMPLKPLFRALNRNYDDAVKIVGQHCRVTTSEANGSYGQAEIATAGAPITINVRTLNDAILHRGDLAVIVREDEEKRVFYITANPLPEPANH